MMSAGGGCARHTPHYSALGGSCSRNGMWFGNRVSHLLGRPTAGTDSEEHLNAASQEPFTPREGFGAYPIVLHT